jgi:hypothetical protein
MEEMKNQCTRCSIVRIRNDGKLPLPDRYFLGLGSGSVWADSIIRAFPLSGHFKHFWNAARCGGNPHHLWNIEPRWEENLITLCDACPVTVSQLCPSQIRSNSKSPISIAVLSGSAILDHVLWGPISLQPITASLGEDLPAFRQDWTQSCTSSGQHIQSRPAAIVCLKKTVWLQKVSLFPALELEVEA